MDRRRFLKSTSLGTAAALAVPTAAATSAARNPIRCGVIGFGPWGREVAATIERVEDMQLAVVCDSYAPMLRRAQRAHREAARTEDYRDVLANPDVDAVMIATPTHLHREIALAALQAGKHVYCEAPMASSLEDARAMVEAADAAPDQIFQVGLLNRTEEQYRSVFQFIRSGALGRSVSARAQWHTKSSMVQQSPNAERRRLANWRLDPDTSLGLIPEQGLQQVDGACWILGGMPTAVTGFGRTMLWNDGRAMPDTEQAIFEFPGGPVLTFHATLASSFDAAYEMFHGTDSTIMMREQKAWMFKEVDAPMLGWEVYARRDKFYKETGIALIANATKLDALGQSATDDPGIESALWFALKAFADNFNFGPFPPIADARLGYAMTVLSTKVREAVREGTRVSIDPEAYRI